MSKKNKDLNNLYQDLLNEHRNRESAGARLSKFFFGLVMLGVGLFMIFNNLSVTSTWGRYGYFYSFGNFNISNGMIMLPLIIGILMIFFMKKRIYGWLVIALGIAIVLVSVLLTTQIHWKTTSGYIFVIMFGLTAAGAGLLLREMLRKD